VPQWKDQPTGRAYRASVTKFRPDTNLKNTNLKTIESGFEEHKSG